MTTESLDANVVVYIDETILSKTFAVRINKTFLMRINNTFPKTLVDRFNAESMMPKLSIAPDMS